MEALPSFTAARIAAVLGRDKRGVRRLLQRVPAYIKVATPGGMADAWRVESLPEFYRTELVRLAKLKGCRDAAHLLAAGIARWTPPVPLSELDQRHIDKARKIQVTLARALALYGGEPRESASALRVAHKDYQREFGPVSERHVRRIFDRVIERDAGEERFNDLALYLDGNVSKAKGKEAILPGLLNAAHQTVFEYIGSVNQPERPTVNETDLIWFSACEAIHRQVERGTREKKARRAMTDLLDKCAVSLSKNAAAIKVLLKRKLARYQECGGVFDLFVDQRQNKSGYFRAVNLDEKTRLLVVGNAAINHSGRLAPAIRELRDAGMYKGVTDEASAAIKATKELQAAQDELKSAKLAADVALLNAREEDQSIGKTPDEQAAIKRQFEQKRLNLRQQFEEAKADEEIQARQSELTETQTSLASKKKELANQDASYAEAMRRADDAYRAIIGTGVKSDAESAKDRISELETKQNAGTASPAEKTELQGLQDRLDLLLEQQRMVGPAYTEEQKRLETALKDNEKTYQDHPEDQVGVRARLAADDIRDQLNAISYYQSASGSLATIAKDNSKAQEEGKIAVIELTAKVRALTDRLGAAELHAATLSGIVDPTAQQQLQDAQQKALAKSAFEEREAARYARRKPLLDESDNPTATADQHAAARAAADRIDAEGLADKIANAVALGISDAEKNKLNTDYNSYLTRAANVQAGQSQKDEKALDQRQLEVMKSEIEGSHNPRAISELHTVLAKHLTDVHEQVSEIMHIIMTENIGPITDVLGQVREQIRDNGAKINRLRAP